MNRRDLLRWCASVAAIALPKAPAPDSSIVSSGKVTITAPALQRFRLADPVEPGGYAQAILLAWNGSRWKEVGFINVHDEFGLMPMVGNEGLCCGNSIVCVQRHKLGGVVFLGDS